MNDHKDPQEGFSFIQETIKGDRINKRRFGKYITIFAVLGLVFGLTASTGFVVIEKWFGDTFEEQERIDIPLDEEQDVTSETVKEEVKEEIKQEIKEEEGEIDQITNFEQIYKELYEISSEAMKSTVIVQSELQDLDLEEQADSKVTGVIVAETQGEILILVPLNIAQDGEKIIVKFNSEKEYPATVKGEHQGVGFSVLSVGKGILEDEEVVIAELGNSNIVKQGDIIIAIGNQFDLEDSIGYGVVSSVEHTYNVVDGNYKLISTDIPMAESGSGVLINMEGEIVGILSPMLSQEGGAEGIGISSMKQIIENLLNAEATPYVGITSVLITDELEESYELPKGLFIQMVEADSPAMAAGVRSGDIVTKIGDREVMAENTFQNYLLSSKINDTIVVQGKRLGQDGYVDVTFDIVVQGR